MVMEYAPGDVMFVDYAGKTLSYFEKSTGEEIKCQVFIATLGYSQKTYIQVFPSQKVIDFIDALNKCVIYFGGIPKAIVPDNLKSAVIKSDRYEPALNRVLEDWANHNNTTVLPARAVKPKDKSLVEGAVKTSYSRVYAPLRDSVFTSIYDLNQAVNVQNKNTMTQKFQKKTIQGNNCSILKKNWLYYHCPKRHLQLKSIGLLRFKKLLRLYGRRLPLLQRSDAVYWPKG